MPTPRLEVTYARSVKEIDRLLSYLLATNSMPANHQYLIAEIVMLRAFSILEEAAKDIALKLCCGASYCNGVMPVISSSASNMSGAETLLKTFSRPRPIQFLKFTNADYLEKSVKRVISITDPYVANAKAHSTVFDEMRKVRNFIAHRSASARNKYKEVIFDVYNLPVKLSIGPFLVSSTRTPTSNLMRYLISIKVILADLIKG